MSRRMEKIDSILHLQISQFLEEKRDFFSPYLLTVKEVKTANDLRNTTVWIAILGKDENEELILEKLERIRRELQSFIGKKITFKFNPKILFKIDHSGASVQKIEQILQKIKNNK